METGECDPILEHVMKWSSDAKASTLTSMGVEQRVAVPHARASFCTSYLHLAQNGWRLDSATLFSR